MAASSTSSVAAKMKDVKISTLSYPEIEAAFAERPEIKERIYNTIPRLPRIEELFIDIAQFVVESRASSLANSEIPNPAKKRKLNASQSAAAGDSNEKIMFEAWNPSSWGALPDISFSIPQRKKLRLEIGFLPEQGLRARNMASNEIQFAARWRDIQYVTCLPVPEKAQAQYMFCVFPFNADGVHISKPAEGKEPAEQIMWTVPNTIMKQSQIAWGLELEAEDTYRSLLLRVLNRCLLPVRKQVEVPNEKEFASQTAQVARKGEKAVHVKAFRGSKDGFLFFLPTGIFWGFKKPLIYFSFDSISSISYTSILQRTFNLNLSANSPPSTSNPADSDPEPQDFEFSMLDQADFNGIDAYIKRHRLQDASMAQHRQAKRFNVNSRDDEDGHGEDGDGKEGGEGKGEKEGELEKARREMEDAEDAEEEEDENFDPGSKGDSEGSGSSGEEEEEGGDGGGEDDDEDEDGKGDLVKRELGSEAEDVSDG